MVTEPPDPDSKAAGSRFKPNLFGADTRHDFHVLKDGDLFAVFSASGAFNAPNTGPGEARSKDGLFFRDTRYLSRMVWYLNGTPLTEMGDLALHSEAGFRSDLANNDLVDSAGRDIPAFTIHVQLDRFLSDGLFDRIVIRNHALTDVKLEVLLDTWADFRDLFEVRGFADPSRGELQPPHFDDGAIRFNYITLDGRVLSTDIVIDPPPHFETGRGRIALSLPPKASREITCVVRVSERTTGKGGTKALYAARHGAADIDRDPPPREKARGAMIARFAHRIERTQRIATSRPAFDAWLSRSSADLALLTSELGTGPYPYAGVPWFSAPFGRDGIVAAMQTLWLDPELSAGVLNFLAATQATRRDAFCDSAPGKILHEHRNGEMARIGAVPFNHYYGGIDQTLLFVILARDYWLRTADLARLRRLEPAIRAALDWAATDGDRDRDGFIEYDRSAESGLRNQGWKDSEDAVFHADGTLGRTPVGLVEVQGYYVAALRAAADLFEVFGEREKAPLLRTQADELVRKIDQVFWDDGLGTYCIAIDGDNRPARVSASNAGHLLFCDALLPKRSDRLIQTLRAPDLWSGWGIRTVSTAAARYNPMGYHTGSVWPHDSSIIAAGAARSGDRVFAAELTGDLFAASTHFPDHRLPELWCGFSRDDCDRPVAFPSACSPQAWSAGAPFLCMQACLGIAVDAPAGILRVTRPVLPAGIDFLDLQGLQIGTRKVDLRFERKAGGAATVETVRAHPGVRVEVTQG